MTHAFRFYQIGGPEVLKWEDVPLAKPGPGEVQLRHTAVGLNFTDIYSRAGVYAPPAFPSGIGLEGAGVVVEVGSGVTEFKPGQRVAYGSGPLGAYAEARNIPAHRLVPLPEGISDKEAAAMMLKGLTAQYLLRRTYKVKSGDTILFHAAAGGVGLIACQWAKALGATVIGTVGSDAKAALAKAHGCDHPVVYTREDFVKRVAEITGGKKVPVVYDSVGKDTFMKSLDCLAPLGLVALFGQSSGAVEPFNLGLLGDEGLALRHPADARHLRRRSQGDARWRQGAVRSGFGEEDKDRGEPDLSAEGRGQGACRFGGAQDHRLDRLYGLIPGHWAPSTRIVSLPAWQCDAWSKAWPNRAARFSTAPGSALRSATHL